MKNGNYFVTLAPASFDKLYYTNDFLLKAMYQSLVNKRNKEKNKNMKLAAAKAKNLNDLNGMNFEIEPSAMEKKISGFIFDEEKALASGDLVPLSESPYFVSDDYTITDYFYIDSEDKILGGCKKATVTFFYVKHNDMEYKFASLSSIESPFTFNAKGQEIPLDTSGNAMVHESLNKKFIAPTLSYLVEKTSSLETPFKMKNYTSARAALNSFFEDVMA